MIVHLRLFIPFLFSWVLFVRVDAQQNVTLDDVDTAIVYAPPGAWYSPDNITNPLDYEGTHMFTDNPEATATFTFTGTAIYFFSPLWPYPVTTAVSLDSGIIHLIDLLDRSGRDIGSGETVQSQVVWSSTGLENKQHTLVVSVGLGEKYAIVDRLTYTEMGPTSSSATSSSTTSSSSSTPSSSSTSSSSTSSSSLSPAMTTSVNPGAVHKKNLSIALGGALGLFLIIFSIVCFCYISRRRRRNLTAWTIDGSSSDGNSLISNNRHSRGYLQSGDSYPLVVPYLHSIEQTVDEKGCNFQYGFVGNMTLPQISPPQPVYDTPAQNHYDHGPSQYAPGYIMTGSSWPSKVGPHSPLLRAKSSATGMSMLTSLNSEDLPGDYVAPASERAGPKQLLVVVGALMDEVETYKGIQTRTPSTWQLSPTGSDESLTVFDSH